MASMYIVKSREDKSRATSMAAVLYRTNLNMTSLHLQYQLGSDMWE